MNRFLEAHLETGRISNLPTVWSNVFVGYILASQPLHIASLLLLMLACSLLYVGGCYLGDAKDVQFDAEHKPARPIPSGVIKRSTCWILGWGMMLLGLIGFIYVGECQWPPIVYGALPLTAVIVFYAFVHKAIPALGLPLIAACRGLLIFSSFFLFYSLGSTEPVNPLWTIIAPAIGLAVYTFGFASVARTEANNNKISLAGLLKIIMLAIPIIVSLIFVISGSVNIPLQTGALVIYIMWLSVAFQDINTNKGAYVSKCLAGFALLDMAYIAHTGIVNTLVCLALFGIALMLQKFAPAT